ncbi:MAG: permease-like cell division protein FtsX [Candidatus Dormibacteria bacterium]|jgi:cell division transport system permease protein
MIRLFAAVRFTLVAAGQNFRRNLAVSMAGVFTMGLILLLVGGTLLLTHTIDGLVTQQETTSSSINIYLLGSISSRTITNYEVNFARDPRVISVGFTSEDQAVVIFKNDGLNTDNVLGVLQVNPLPPSIDLKVHKLSELSQFNSLARSLPIVDESAGKPTNYNADVIPRLEAIAAWIFGIGLVLSIVLAIISLVIIMNTIRTAVYIRRTEVEIMKLVGATDWFVRWPFILEGVFGGVLAAVFGSVIVVLGYRLLIGLADAKWLGVSYDATFLAALVAILVAVGAALGAFGSYLGVRRFLNV